MFLGMSFLSIFYYYLIVNCHYKKVYDLLTL